MARIFSQLALPPLQEQLSLLQNIDDQNTTHRSHYSMSRTYQYPDRLFHHHRNDSKSPSPVLISRIQHPRSGIREDRDHYRAYQEHHQYRESLPSFSSLLNGINQSTNQSIKFEFDARNSTPNFKPSSPDRYFPAAVFESRKRPRTSTYNAKTHSNSLTHSSDYLFANSKNPKVSPLQSSPLSFTNQRPQSPIHDVRQNVIDTQRSQAPYSVETWSPNSHSSPLDFSGKANPTPLNFDSENTPSPRHRPEPKRLKVFEYQELAVHTSNYLKSPTMVQDSTNTRNGLGPKIWAGNRFLPQFTHEAYVPGEGTCYFYDDGTRCKSVIDGEVVNKYWGVTKTGKPRKRLAIACMTCREKKIKCDPDYPQCDQCKKFGRTCRFKNARDSVNSKS
ncbi:putative fungal specific transcription factor domain-containing protein [Erysiphe neolycopersici]|uniref:Putative fungal specific transcription factor domain-containing protein n=1 Tax=Erysiphe neolycopersici TaxID=212602 RepID=A0A420HZU4_9PEZI|nr:putative fungal specific transcription factor domain-containing protein [Erysiphe neolycopersici]